MFVPKFSSRVYTTNIHQPIVFGCGGNIRDLPSFVLKRITVSRTTNNQWFLVKYSWLRRITVYSFPGKLPTKGPYRNPWGISNHRNLHHALMVPSRPVAGFSNAWEAVTLRLSAVDPSILVPRGLGAGEVHEPGWNNSCMCQRCCLHLPLELT